MSLPKEILVSQIDGGGGGWSLLTAISHSYFYSDLRCQDDTACYYYKLQPVIINFKTTINS